MATVGNLNIFTTADDDPNTNDNINTTDAKFVTFFDDAVTSSDSPINRSVDTTIDGVAVKVWTVKGTYNSEEDDFDIKFILDQSSLSAGMKVAYDCTVSRVNYKTERTFNFGYTFGSGGVRTIIWNKNFFLIYSDEGYDESDYGNSWRGCAYGVEKMYNVETEQYEWKPFMWIIPGEGKAYFRILDLNRYSNYTTNVFRFASMPPYTTGCGQKITAAIPMFQDTKPFCSRHLYFIYRYQPPCDGNNSGTFSLNSKFTDLEGNERPCITIKNMLIFGDVEEVT